MATPPGMRVCTIFDCEKPPSIPPLQFLEGYWKIYVVLDDSDNTVGERYWEFLVRKIQTRGNQFIAIHRKHNAADGIVMTSGFWLTTVQLVEVKENGVMWWRLVITVESQTNRYNIMINLVSFQ